MRGIKKVFCTLLMAFMLIAIIPEMRVEVHAADSKKNRIITKIEDVDLSKYTKNLKLQNSIYEILNNGPGIKGVNGVRKGVSIYSKIGSKELKNHCKYSEENTYFDYGCNSSEEEHKAMTESVYWYTNGIRSASSCWMYAFAVYHKLFNISNLLQETDMIKSVTLELEDKQEKLTKENLDKWLKSIGVENKTGVYLRVGGHSIIVLDYNDDYLYYLDANGDGIGLVAIREELWKELGKKNGNMKMIVKELMSPTKDYFDELYPDCDSFNKTGKHNWNKLGVCVDCDKVCYKDAEELADGTIEPNGCIFSPIVIRKEPYEVSKELYKTSFESVEVIGTVVNHYNHLWYKVRVPNSNKKGYVYCTNTTKKFMTKYYKEALGPGVIMTENLIVPKSSLNNGKAIQVAGKIRSSKSLVNISVRIEDKKGSVKYEYKTPDSFNNKTFNLNTAASSLKFNKLSVGDYKYIIEVEAIGTEVNRYQYDFSIPKTANKSRVYVVKFAQNEIDNWEVLKVESGSTIIISNSVSAQRYCSGNFIGYSTDPNATTPDYFPGQIYTPNESVTLYPVYEEIQKPTTPTFTQKSFDVAVGSNINLSWWSSNGADKYIVDIYRNDGSVYKTQETVGLTTAFNIDEAGSFTAKVKAVNVVGESEQSQAVSIVTHGPSTVDFVNYDGSTWSSQSVAYGSSATIPVSPTREGYEFAGWVGSYNNVTSNKTITATYNPIKYEVSFYDFNGNLVNTQQVTYDGDNPGMAVEPNVSELNIPDGYLFLGYDNDEWKSVKRSGIKVYPSCVWANADVPITTQIDTITATYNTNSSIPIGYWIDYSLQNHVNEAKTGRFVAVLKNSDGKFLAKTESGAFYIGANSSYSGELYVPVDSTNQEEAYAEFYVVDKYETLVPISEVSAKYLAEDSITYLTGWMTESEYNSYIQGKNITATNTKTQYRYSDISISDWTSYPNMEGWIPYDSRTIKSEWSGWSGWQDENVASNDNTNVQTRQVQLTSAYEEYRYGRYYTSKKLYDGSKWVNGNVHYSDNVAGWYYGRYDENAGVGSSNWKWEWSDWSTTRFQVKDTYSEKQKFQDSVQTGRLNSSTGKVEWTVYRSPKAIKGFYSYYYEESRTIPATYKTQYNYQTRYDITQYRHYYWNAWTDWSDEYVAANSERQVESRTLYQAQVKEVLNDTVVQPTGGEQISGKISGLDNPEGKLAILNIYKVDEASDYSNEFIAMTKLDSEGNYTFSGIHTYEEPSIKTGDFTVTLTIEGSTGPVVIETNKFKAPKKTYTVEFIDELGDENNNRWVQVVEDGDSAIAPTLSEKEGYIFVGWEYGLTNIHDDMVIRARYVKKNYVVVFIDWLKGTVTMVEDVPYGTTIYGYKKGEQPKDDGLYVVDPDETEGYIFMGWQTSDGQMVSTVTKNMVVSAVYDRLAYNVKFLDENGEIISSQVVGHGDRAELPFEDEVYDDVYEEEGDEPEQEATEPEEIANTEDNDEMYIAGWNSEDIYGVTHDLIVSPIMKYYYDAPEATVNLESGTYYGPQTLEITVPDEDTTVIYEVDGLNFEVGSEAGENIYTEPIVLLDSATVEITTRKEGTNDTSVIYEYVIVPEEAKPADPSNLQVVISDDKAILSWNVTNNADGYIIERIDSRGNVCSYMTDTNSYIDDNLITFNEYTYTVKAYRNYREIVITELDSPSGSKAAPEPQDYGHVARVFVTYLESDGTSNEETINYIGDQYVVNQIIVHGEDSVAKGNNSPYLVTVNPYTAYDQSVTWSVEELDGKASISADGILTAKKAGNVIVKARANDGSEVVGQKEIEIYETDSSTIGIHVDSRTIFAESDKDFSINVTIDENSNASLIQFCVIYDSSLLTLNSAEIGSLMSELAPTINDTQEGIVRFAWDSVEELTEGGVLMTLNFTAIADGDGDALIYIPTDDEEFEYICSRFDESLLSMDKIDSLAFNGHVSIFDISRGDVYVDGKINVMDANMVRRYAAKLIDLNEVQLKVADVSGDGKVNIIDANLIRRYVAKLIDKFPASN